MTGVLLAGAVSLGAAGSTDDNAEPFDAADALAAEDGVGSLLASAVRAVAGHDGSPSEDGGDGPVRLRVPSSEPLLTPPSAHLPEAVPAGERRAHAYQFISRVFERPSKRPRAIGYVRRGMVLHAGERVPGPGCKGVWYSLVGQPGYVCSSDGFAVQREPRAQSVRQRVPDVARALPFEYAKAKSPDALRFYDIPSEADEAEIARATQADQRLPDVVQRRMDGVFLLALDREEQAGERSFYRTVRGHYVRTEDVELKPEPKMRGVRLGKGKSLPYAFVYDHAEQPAAVYRVERGNKLPQHVGVAENHARIAVARVVDLGGRRLLVSPDGLALQRSDVRVVRRHARPEGVPPGVKWIHVDLDEQALVAYEGDTPVFATLVSSGLDDGFATPAGLYQVREKHISTTMSGPDPDAGYYEVEQVPWTMYYHDSYALHGAYWHDTFGKTRSHGCTNISPVDARWLFYWSDDPVPAGWNARRKLKGTWVYFTRES